MTNSKHRSEELAFLETRITNLYPCPEWEEKLVYLHPDDLAEIERMELFKHISQCSACAEFRRRYRAINEIIRDIPFSEEIPTLELPPKLMRLWKFEDMQEEYPLSAQEALLQILPAEISASVGSGGFPDKDGDFKEFSPKERKKIPAINSIWSLVSIIMMIILYIWRRLQTSPEETSHKAKAMVKPSLSTHLTAVRGKIELMIARQGTV